MDQLSRIPQRIRKTERILGILPYLCIPLNALSAGSIFCFPMFAPSLASHFNLTQGQLSSIALGGMMGQYPFATLWGVLIDRVGPWACSLSAGALFLVGHSTFAAIVVSQSLVPGESVSATSFFALVLCFFLAGLGTVASFFSALFSGSKMFPERTGLATGVITALFGFSPLFLSSIGSLCFPDANDGLDAPRYLTFLALFCGGVNLFGAIGLKAIPGSRPIELDSLSSSSYGQGGEVEPLIQRPIVPSKEHETLVDLLRDVDFWLLGTVMLVTMGISEMIISNIGTIVSSLAPRDSAAEVSSVTTGSQVRLISLANTLSRLLTGPTADFTSPVPVRHSSGELVAHPKRTVTRVVFLMITSVLLLVSALFMSFGIRSLSGVWFLSLTTGAAYGMIWTVVPSISEALWGSSHSARNFGTISYAAFIGTPIFTLVYASISDAAREKGSVDTICRGVVCWRSTFAICSAILLGAVGMSGVLWTRLRRVV